MFEAWLFSKTLGIIYAVWFIYRIFQYKMRMHYTFEEVWCLQLLVCFSGDQIFSLFQQGRKRYCSKII
ncbi:hypothetical protein FF1_024486 [Malus domestica]